MSQYGQFCPVAKAMELLDERWTMLIVRELIAGQSHASATCSAESRRCRPRCCPRACGPLARAGVIDRHEQGKRVYYTLTPAGRELRAGRRVHRQVGHPVDARARRRRTTTRTC